MHVTAAGRADQQTMLAAPVLFGLSIDGLAVPHFPLTVVLATKVVLQCGVNMWLIVSVLL